MPDKISVSFGIRFNICKHIFCAKIAEIYAKHRISSDCLLSYCYQFLFNVLKRVKLKHSVREVSKRTFAVD